MILGFAGIATAAASTLPLPVEAALERASVPRESLGFALIPLLGGAEALSYRSDTAMQPGSTMKLVTTVGALATLGPNHRASTALLTEGDLRQGVLRGNVVLRGGADPDLDVPALWDLLYRLRASGVRRIRGDVILDRSYFAPERFDLGLAPFDEAPDAQYNVIPDALNLNGSLLRFDLAADTRKVVPEIYPPLRTLKVRSAQTVTERACADWEAGWQPPEMQRAAKTGRTTITLKGSFPAGCKISEDLQLVERDLLAAHLIRELWTDLGGRLDGTVRSGRAQPTATRVAEHRARPLAEVIRHMNKASDNPLTRLVFLSIGAQMPAEQRAAYATTFAASEARVRSWFEGQGIDPAGIVFDNGSGLSRSEKIAPQQMVRMLDVAWRQPWAPEFIASLPLVGVDGTMRNRLKGTPAEARARIKTGTLRNVVAIAGYVYDADNRPWAVSAMVNDEERARHARPVLDALLAWMASTPTAAIRIEP